MICGVDEAGRGPLAGSMKVCAVVLNKTINGLNDSKKLSLKKRELLFEEITQNSKYLILTYSNKDIDKNGLSYCLNDALNKIVKEFKECKIIFDGNSSFGVDGIETLVKADEQISEVSAASILAKVTRDREMLEADLLYPQYEFAKHKGYGTKKHMELLKQYGACEIHRLSFKGCL